MATVTTETKKMYCSTGSTDVYYNCYLTYDEPTRSGTTVTLSNVVLHMARSSKYSYNRLAWRVGKSSGGSDIKANETINSSGTASASSYTKTINSITYTTLEDTVYLYVAVASTGSSADWNNFRGNSPVILINAAIPCPGANPTFTTNPTVSATNETEVSLTTGIVDIESNFYYTTNDGTNWTAITESPMRITGLTANTSYNFKIKAANKADETLYTISDAISITTYAYPTVSTWPGNFSMDASTKTVNFTFANPLGREIIMAAKIGNTSVGSGTTSSTTGSISINCDTIYSNMGASATSATITFTATSTFNLSSSTTKTASAAEAYAKPTVKTAGFVWTAVQPSGFPYTATSKMVQNKSYLKVSYSSLANIGTANKGSTLSSATVTFGGKSAQTLTTTATAYINTSTVFNYASTQKATITVKDSRNYTNTATVDIPFVAYQAPVATIGASRNGTTITLTFNATYSSLESTNGISKFTWKAGSSGTTTDVTVASGSTSATATPTLATTATQTYYVRAVDKAGTAGNWVSVAVSVEQPILFVDTDNQGVGINGFSNGDGLYINGKRTLSYFTINLTNGTNENFYPVTFDKGISRVIDCEIHSPSYSSSAAYNQNYIQFQICSCGWNDLKPQFTLLQYGVYQASEITIGYIGRGTQGGGRVAIWLRGGFSYQFYCNEKPTPHLTDYTEDQETFTVGTNFYGGSNVNVEKVWQAVSGTNGWSGGLKPNSAMLMAYPIGAIYLAYGDTSPATFFGGTWERLKSRFLYACGDNDSVGTSSSTGTNTTSITLSAEQSGCPAHTHEFSATASGDFYIRHGNSSGMDTVKEGTNVTINENVGEQWANGFSTSTYSHKIDQISLALPVAGTTDSSTGTNATTGHDHEVPYCKVYVWRRTA